MVYKHAVVAAFHICAQRGEDVAKGKVGSHELNSHGNYIVDHGKSWNCVLNFCGNPVTHKELKQGKKYFNIALVLQDE